MRAGIAIPFSAAECAFITQQKRAWIPTIYFYIEVCIGVDSDQNKVHRRVSKGDVMAKTIYQRGQMEWALWQHFGNRMGAHAGKPMPRVFANRIKRMLDLDAAKTARVFAADGYEGSGNTAGYDEYGVFLMALALVLLDGGLKQSDVLFLLRHLKDRLRIQYTRIQSNPPAPGQMIFSKDRPNSPVHPYHPNMADCSVFLLIHKVEMLECWTATKRSPDEPMILGPKFCYGLEALRKELDRLNFDYPSETVIEFADMAMQIEGYLKKAPSLKRGRKKAE